VLKLAFGLAIFKGLLDWREVERLRASDRGDRPLTLYEPTANGLMRHARWGSSRAARAQAPRLWTLLGSL